MAASAQEARDQSHEDFAQRESRKTMIRQELARMLVCPENRRALEIAPDELVAKLNRAIEARQLMNRVGQKVQKPLSGGLVRDDRSILYPIVDDIPMMLIDEGIPLDQSALANSH